jgi:hypothetical protein
VHEDGEQKTHQKLECGREELSHCFTVQTQPLEPL